MTSEPSCSLYIVGAFAAAWTGGELTGTWVPQLREDRFGGGAALRSGAGFAGGLIMAYGARLAGGCTSGHRISGALQLSVSSWIALACFFVAAVATAMLMYRL